MELGEQIKLRRKELHITQDELANRMHISRSAISNWEIGRNYPDILLLVQLSDELQISLDQLLRDDKRVVADISDKMQEGEKLKKKIRVLYILLAVLFASVLLFFFHAERYADVSDPDQILSVEFDQDEIHIATNLPFYRSIYTYMVNNSADGSTLEIALVSKIDFTLKNKNTLDIPLNDVPEEYSEIKTIHFLYDGTVIKEFDYDR